MYMRDNSKQLTVIIINLNMVVTIYPYLNIPMSYMYVDCVLFSIANG